MVSTYSPMYSSHGHGRKTHLASEDGSLCRVEERYPDLLWTMGVVYYSVEEQFLIDPDEYGCLRCRKVYLRSLRPQKSPT